MGLVQLLPNGKARLVPITILYDGEFYDAGAYKASPVPMALESGTVYEGVRTGVSQGLFTVSSALQGNNTWIGNGTWQSNAAIAAAKEAAAKRKEVMSKPAPEPVEGPPVLRRASAKPKPAEDAPAAPPASPGPASPAPPASAPAPSAPPPATSEEDSDRPVLKRPATEAAPTAATSPAAAEAQAEADPDRPVLKRGAPTAEELKKRSASTSTTSAKESPRSKAPPPAASSPIQVIPAISDAAGPDPRPYAYSLKPDEEQTLRKKMLALAAEEVRAWAAQPEATGAQPAPRAAKKAKPPQPAFEDVKLHAFDLSNSNEPCWY